MENVLNIGDIVAYALAIGGLVTTLITVISTATRAGRETQNNIHISKQKASEDIETQKLDNNVKKIELNEKLKRFYDDLIDDMNLKFDVLEKETEAKAIKVKAETETKERKMELELETIRIEQILIANEKNTLREAGLLLIKAVEKSLQLRDIQVAQGDMSICNACQKADQELLETLKEIKSLFQNGKK